MGRKSFPMRHTLTAIASGSASNDCNRLQSSARIRICLNHVSSHLGLSEAVCYASWSAVDSGYTVDGQQNVSNAHPGHARYTVTCKSNHFDIIPRSKSCMSSDGKRCLGTSPYCCQGQPERFFRDQTQIDIDTVLKYCASCGVLAVERLCEGKRL